jgi:hypothetical protein
MRQEPPASCSSAPPLAHTFAWPVACPVAWPKGEELCGPTIVPHDCRWATWVAGRLNIAFAGRPTLGRPSRSSLGRPGEDGR